MKITLDNRLTRILADNPSEIISHDLISMPESHIHFNWPSLLEYLDLSSSLPSLDGFDVAQPLFDTCIHALSTIKELETIQYLYDSLFTECLNQIKAVPDIHAARLLQSINVSKLKPSYQIVEKTIASSLTHYEDALHEKPSETLHDLILYLAWDRMCICIGRLFDYPCADQIFIQNLDILKKCLLESYLHITEHGRTQPSLYRLLEAFFYLQMREENIEKHSAEEWEMLSKSFKILSDPNKLINFDYIDRGVKEIESEQDAVSYLTIDHADRIDLRITLTKFLIDKIRTEHPEWKYTFLPQHVTFYN